MGAITASYGYRSHFVYFREVSKEPEVEPPLRFTLREDFLLYSLFAVYIKAKRPHYQQSSYLIE